MERIICLIGQPDPREALGARILPQAETSASLASSLTSQVWCTTQGDPEVESVTVRIDFSHKKPKSDEVVKLKQDVGFPLWGGSEQRRSASDEFGKTHKTNTREMTSVHNMQRAFTGE